MFYATKIKQVSGDKAIDERGKILSFIGYLPVTVGDMVFTDGAVIFGNVKVKGGYSVFEEDRAGVPVLGEENLRGFFKTNGRYRKYKIAGENWLVNGKEKFFHDTSEEKILDAEISLNEDGVYTITKESIKIKDASSVDYKKWRNELFIECFLIIKKDGTEKERIALSTLLKPAEDFALGYVNFFEIPEHEPKDYISVTADICNAKIMPDGSWKILVECSVDVERVYNCINKILDLGTREETSNRGKFPSDFPWGGSREEIAEAFRKIGCTEVTVNEVIYDGELAKEIYNIVYDDLRPWSWHEWIITYGASGEIETKITATNKHGVTTASCTFLLEFSSDGSIEKCAESTYCEPLYMQEYEESLSPPAEEGTFPQVEISYTSEKLSGGYHWEFSIYNMRGLALMKHLEEDNRQYTPVSTVYYTYDSSKLPEAPVYNERFYNAKESFTFPIQDGYHAKIIPQLQLSGNRMEFCFGGVYDSEGKLVISNGFTSTDANTWNMSIAPLNDKTFLFGIHDSDFYRINAEGGATKINSQFKNFRLRELKDIRKAKT